MSCRSFFGVSLSLILFLTQGQSVLTTGNWYKVGITETNIYKIDRNFLKRLGLPVGTLDPRTIKVYGNGGGGVLPQLNSADRPTDLTENAIFAVGENDGSLDNEDFFLFFGKSPHKMNWSLEGLDYEKNLYSDTTYYFITFEGVNGKRIQTGFSGSTNTNFINTYDDAIVHELDKDNLLRSGRIWHGESFSRTVGLNLQLNFTRSNVVLFESLTASAIAQSELDCSMDFLINGEFVGSLQMDAIPFGENSRYSYKADRNEETFILNKGNDNISFDINFNPNGTTSIAYLDHLELLLKRKISYANESLFIRSIESLNFPTVTYQISNGSADVAVWDVTHPTHTIRLNSKMTDGIRSFTSESTTMREFVIFSDSDTKEPEIFGSIKNQNIQAISSVDGLIITHPTFVDQAQRLADFHNINSGLKVEVVTTNQVFNEFSSGMQDITALRDFARHVYKSGNTLKYLLLFGDASYSYKNQLHTNSNFVPIYQSRETFSPIYSHSSDDYFGFFEDHEGEWDETNNGDHTLEIGVGRIPATTRAEAQIVVDKILRYSTSTRALGSWRNEVVYIADDGDANIHMRQCEDLIEIITNEGKLDSKKLYLDAFEQTGTGFGESPTVKRAIQQSFENGALFMNFLGHGNPNQWMDERVLLGSDIDNLRNYQKLPILTTATCEFGRYDDPFRTSGAEKLICSDKGAIALLTTSRPVFAQTNFVLNLAYHQSLINAKNDLDIRLGDIIRSTKNNSLQGAVNRNFALLGDPMLRPAYPKYNVRVDEFEIGENITLSALKTVKLTGQILNGDSPVNDFNGVIEISLLDVPTKKITFGNENSPFEYLERDNRLFNGLDSVENGQFSIEFTLPRNISYSNKTGKISLYAMSQDSNEDATGVYENLIIGGTAQTYKEDNNPPSLNIYINEPTFRNGDFIGSGAVLIAKFEDESGINISNIGFDRGITMDINGELIEINSFYTADIGQSNKGTVVYPLSELEAGSYRVKIKATDLHNNPVEGTVEFVVSDLPILQTYDFNMYPNPTSSSATFSFSHDREGEPLTVELNVYSTNGQQSWIGKHEIDFSERNEQLDFNWKKKSMEDGIYIYNLKIRSKADGALAEEVGRLVIQN